MTESLTITERFCGPPGSANGGYACGLTAAPLGDGPVEVTLRLPPPVGRPLRLEVEADSARLLDGDTEISSARRVDAELPVPDPIDRSTADRAAAAFDEPEYHASHLYPGCFTCGPARKPGDGLRLFPGVTDRPGLFAWPWTPDPSTTVDGAVSTPVMWAALDCPGGTAWLSGPDVGAIVLGRLTAQVHRRPEPGESLVVAGWRGDRQERRLGAGSAVWSESGALLAAGMATWIVLTPEQAAAFGAAGAG